MISNIPQSTGTRRAIRRMFKHEFNKDSEIKDIVFVFRDEEMMELKDKKYELEKEVNRA
jgi:hypothetical protein